MAVQRVALLVLLLSAYNAATGPYQATWESLDTRPLPQWYDDVKFGLFPVWGVYSVPAFGSEWFWFRWKNSRQADIVDFMAKNYPPRFGYPDFAPQFRAELFDPDEWADVMASSGAKYLVLTAKFHDGFVNWNTTTAQNWNSMDVGPQRDLVGELAVSIKNRTDIHFGVYFSHFEWYHPLYLKDKAANYQTQSYLKEVNTPQLQEIVHKYQPDVIWGDGEWEANSSYWNSTEFLAWLFNESPVKDTVVVNDRWGKDVRCKHGSYWTCQDQYQPGHLVPHKWESCMKIQTKSWGYIRDTDLTGYLNITQILYRLVSTVSYGGNYLLNFGPTADGRIMPVFKELFNKTGSWLAINGEAIYSTTPWKTQNDPVSPYVWYTLGKKTGNVYAILVEWPETYQLTLGAIKGASPSSISLLGFESELKFSPTDQGMSVTLPYLPLKSNLMWAWTLCIKGLTTSAPDHKGL